MRRERSGTKRNLYYLLMITQTVAYVCVLIILLNATLSLLSLVSPPCPQSRSPPWPQSRHRAQSDSGFDSGLVPEFKSKYVHVLVSHTPKCKDYG